MDERTPWRRLDAGHWVHVLLTLQTTVWALLTAWTLLAGVFTGFVLFAVVPGGIAALCGRLASAWRRERTWAWWVAATLGGAGVLLSLGDLLIDGPSWPVVVGLAVHGVLVLLLSHPDSRARIQPAPADAAPPCWARTRS